MLCTMRKPAMPLAVVLSCFSWFGLGVASPLHASVERIVEVTQPILTESGIWLSTTTHLLDVGTPTPGLEVSLTCTPTRLSGVIGESDRNAASLTGLRVTVLRPLDTPRLPPARDTLIVVLDASHAHSLPTPFTTSLDTVIRATMDAIRENADRAAGRWPSLRQVTITLLGTHGRHRSVTHSLHPLRSHKQYALF